VEELLAPPVRRVVRGFAAVRPATARVPAGVRVAVAAGTVVACWAVATGVAGALHVPTAARAVALFGHLAGLVVGLGAVVAVDWLGLLWAVGRRSFAEVTRTASALHPLICAALLALLVTGAVLHPDMTSGLTRVKLALVLVIAVNGLYVTALQAGLSGRCADPPPGLLAQATAAVVVSQLCWWATVAIGLANARR
jgi:hypothetical protein